VFSNGVCFRTRIETVAKDLTLWQSIPIFNELFAGELSARLARAGDPGYRAALCDFYEREENEGGVRRVRLHEVSLVSACGSVRFSSNVGRTLDDIARTEEQPVTDVLLDLLLETAFEAELSMPGFSSVDAEANAAIALHPRIVPGASDGGAHVKFYSGGHYGTDIIGWLARDQGLATLEQVHHKLSAVPARLFGFEDRGTLMVGSFADLMIYDLQRLGYPERYDRVADLPNGDWRRVARATGIRWVIVNGEITFHDNECTGSLPGRVLGFGTTIRT
jgi:N-acyl-D-aspartate/D-glutamate deacylase